MKTGQPPVAPVIPPRPKADQQVRPTVATVSELIEVVKAFNAAEELRLANLRLFPNAAGKLNPFHAHLYEAATLAARALKPAARVRLVTETTD